MPRSSVSRLTRAQSSFRRSGNEQCEETGSSLSCGAHAGSPDGAYGDLPRRHCPLPCGGCGEFGKQLRPHVRQCRPCRYGLDGVRVRYGGQHTVRDFRGVLLLCKRPELRQLCAVRLYLQSRAHSYSPNGRTPTRWRWRSATTRKENPTTTRTSL